LRAGLSRRESEALSIGMGGLAEAVLFKIQRAVSLPVSRYRQEEAVCCRCRGFQRASCPLAAGGTLIVLNLGDLPISPLTECLVAEGKLSMHNSLTSLTKK
jgi:hypothetical protein